MDDIRKLVPTSHLKYAQTHTQTLLPNDTIALDQYGGDLSTKSMSWQIPAVGFGIVVLTIIGILWMNHKKSQTK